MEIQHSIRWGSYPSLIGAAIVPVILSAEQVALGANGSLLAVAAAGINTMAAIAILFILKPDLEFWRGAFPVLLLVAAAFLWVAVPGLFPGLFRWAPPRAAPDLSLSAAARLGGGFALLLAGGWVGYRRVLMRISLQLIMAAGVLVILVGMILQWIDSGHVWGYDKALLAGRFTGTLLNANANATLAGVTATLGLAGLLSALRQHGGATTQRIWWIVNAMACVGGAAACAATGSRTVLVLLAVLLVAQAIADTAARRAAISPAGLIAAMVMGVVLSFLVIVADETTFDRFGALESGLALRRYLLQHFYTIAMQSPWIGYGPMSFDTINERAMDDPATAMATWYIHSPHDTALSMILTGGLPYLLLMTLAAGTMIVQVLRSGPAVRGSPYLRGAVAAAVLILSSATVDIQTDVPAVSGLLIYLGALAWGRAIRARADTDPASSVDRSIPTQRRRRRN